MTESTTESVESKIEVQKEPDNSGDTPETNVVDDKENEEAAMKDVSFALLLSPYDCSRFLLQTESTNVSVPLELSTPHPLQCRWALWYLKGDRSKDWEDCLKRVSVFDTVEDFWAYVFYDI